ncbi:GNAT family N-acetyltransferase [Terricaulis silvestris]|uniref:Aminoglycoside N(6')-acetyltransferase type 1 n=1 Tax=Terricaulis silvestris TaxID=2686094 RepID=A0A6I6MNP4_9CAUL|nr:GNAT family N-acetyltransferase [Terricaulis silvestris]QGZ95741.1 Aminoglycoside N(6')-acetyltransferase type 1 [Terricaulis silvestris]
MQIRRAVPRDADAIAKLAADAAAEEGAVSGLEADRIKAHAFGSTALFEAWVAQERNNAPIIAHAIITKSYDMRRAAPTVVLCELYVAPSHRRGGLARKMMSAVARRASELGARELAITTGVENEVAQKFFAAVGARPRQAAVFMMSADGIEWLAAEGL